MNTNMLIHDYSTNQMNIHYDDFIPQNNYSFLEDVLGNDNVEYVTRFNVNSYDELVKFADELESIVLKVDWSVWFDIYADRVKRGYEYAGTIVHEDDNYYSMLVFKGDEEKTISVRGVFGDALICIHSHPMSFDDDIEYSGSEASTRSDEPSSKDYHGSMNRCSIVVTPSGVIIYGSFNGGIWNGLCWEDCNDHVDYITYKYDWSMLNVRTAINKTYIKFVDRNNVRNVPKIYQGHEIFVTDIIDYYKIHGWACYLVCMWDYMYEGQVIFDYYVDFVEDVDFVEVVEEIDDPVVFDFDFDYDTIEFDYDSIEYAVLTLGLMQYEPYLDAMLSMH